MAEEGEIPSPTQVPTKELLTRLPERTAEDRKLRESLTKKVDLIKAEKREIAADIKFRKELLLETGLHQFLFKFIISDADFKSTNDEHYWGVRAAERKVRKKIWDHLPESAKRNVLLKLETRSANLRGGNK